MQRKGSAVWKGGIKEGHGMISTESKMLSNAPYSFHTRFESTPGTNPEELISAAHAACFSMALSLVLEGQGIKLNQVNTEATATLEKLSDGWRVTAIHLDVVGDISNGSEAIFEKAAKEAKENCPVSRLMNANITMNAKLKQRAA
jgi:osmotically inducible protein OsmC